MKKILNTDKAPAPVGPYNQSILTGNTLYISGQIAIDPASGNLLTEDIETETHQVMKNLAAVLDNAGMDFSHVVKCSVFVSDMENYARINAVYGSYFDEATAPARELVQVSVLPKRVNVEVSAVAYNG